MPWTSQIILTRFILNAGRYYHTLTEKTAL